MRTGIQGLQRNVGIFVIPLSKIGMILHNHGQYPKYWLQASRLKLSFMLSDNSLIFTFLHHLWGNDYSVSIKSMHNIRGGGIDKHSNVMNCLQIVYKL